MTIGKLIRKRRKDLGITQVYIGKKLGYTSQYVANWEREASTPPLEKMRRICELLEIPKKLAVKTLVSDYVRQIERNFE